MKAIYLKHRATPFVRCYEWVKITDKHAIVVWENKIEVEDNDEETQEEVYNWYVENLDMEESTQEEFDKHFIEAVQLINSLYNK